MESFPINATPGNTESQDMVVSVTADVEERPLLTKYRSRKERPVDFSPVNVQFSQGIRQEDEVTLGQVDPESRYLTNIEANESFGGEAGRFELPDVSSIIADIKQNHDPYDDTAEVADELFSELLIRASNGVIEYRDLVKLYEESCRGIGDSVIDEADLRDRSAQGHYLRQKASMLHAEAATWSLVWHLLCKENDGVVKEDFLLNPAPSQQSVGFFLAENLLAQRCLRIVQWLESLVSLKLDRDLQQKGGYLGNYTPRQGVWRPTLYGIRNRQPGLPSHVDPDAPTRENARLHPEDEKFEAELLADVWTLIQAGRLSEARQLCRSAGQSWRAASLGGCGDEGPSPPLADWVKKGRGMELQALELDTGFSKQRFIWKWACYSLSEKIVQSRAPNKYEAAVYAAFCSNLQRMLPVCTTWEAACWAMTRAWLDEQVDSYLVSLRPVNFNLLGKGTTQTNGVFLKDPQATARVLHEWPKVVKEQQPADLTDLFRKLQSSEQVHEGVRRSCKETHRMLQMELMQLDVCDILERLRIWNTVGTDRSPSDSHFLRVGAHLVLLLRELLPAERTQIEVERLQLVGDMIITSYAIHLISSKPELVALYASKLAPPSGMHTCLNLLYFKSQASFAVREKIIQTALQHLPLDGSDNAVLDILDRVVENSRTFNVTEGDNFYIHVKREGLRRVNAIRWLCFDPPEGIVNSSLAHSEMCVRALAYGNTLFREFSLASLGGPVRPPDEALQLTEILSIEVLTRANQLGADSSVGASILRTNNEEIDCWQEYVAFESFYHQWVELEASQSSQNERVFAAQQALAASPRILRGAADTWLPDSLSEASEDPQWLELHVYGALIASDSGSPVVLDSSICESFANALEICVGKEVSSHRDLKVDIKTHPQDPYILKVVLRCSPEQGDGIGFEAHPSGGLLAGVVAAAIKGDLPNWQSGSSLLAVMVEAYAVTDEDRIEARSLVIGLCRLCCLPELALHCMKLRLFLARTVGLPEEDSSDLVQNVVKPLGTLHKYFNQRQLAALLEYERQALVGAMYFRETRLGVGADTG